MSTPADIQSLCNDLNGRRLVYIVNKTITKTDLDRVQSRLRLPGSCEIAIQQELLSLEQQAAANFLSQSEMERMVKMNFLKHEDMKRATEMEGVPVQVFVFSPGEPMKQGPGILKRWNCGFLVIHGGDALRAWNHLSEGCVVELWGFKDDKNKVYFAIHKV